MEATVKRWLAVALVGGLVCSVCDHLHVAFGVLYYTHPDVFQQAWWTPLIFIGASVAMPAGVALFRRLGPPITTAPSTLQLGAAALLFVVAYAFTAFASHWSNVVLVVLLLVWLARIALGAPRWLILYSVAVAAVGVGVEASLSSIGAFHYRHPDALGVARWLPFLYLHAGLLAGPVRSLIDGSIRP